MVVLLIGDIQQERASGMIVLLKNNQEILLDLAHFILHEKPGDEKTATIPLAWYNKLL